jgi:hypothetical protein
LKVEEPEERLHSSVLSIIKRAKRAGGKKTVLVRVLGGLDVWLWWLMALIFFLVLFFVLC